LDHISLHVLTGDSNSSRRLQEQRGESVEELGVVRLW
jgi:hypothetical protein